MKKLVLMILIILTIITSGCTTTEVDQKQPDIPKTYTTPESKEEISIWLPDWEEAESDDPNNNLTLTNGQCSVGVNIIDFPPEFYKKAVEDYIIENNGTILSRSPLSYTLTIGKYTFKTQTKKRGMNICSKERTLIIFNNDHSGGFYENLLRIRHAYWL